MGYTTDFHGSLKFSRQLTLDEKREIDDISDKDWRDDKTRPCEHSYYCQWRSDDDGLSLKWDENEKFYGYIEWLKWLVEKFFEPKGIKLNGVIDWYGEENSDMGRIIVKDNEVVIKEAKIIYD